MTKLLLLDLDGTIRRCKSNPNGFINEPDDQELIEGVEAAISLYQGWKIYGITNQGGVEAGYKSFFDCVEEQRITLDLLRNFIDVIAILFCPDMAGQKVYFVGERLQNRAQALHEWDTYKFLNGTYRKPNTGMLRLCSYFCRGIAIDPYPEPTKTDTLLIGDRPEDEQAAANAGIDFMWAHEWRMSHG